MAVKSRSVSVTTSPTKLTGTIGIDDGDGVPDASGSIFNDGSVRVFLGGADVAATGSTKGLPLDPGDTADYNTTSALDEIYGVVATGTCSVTVFELGVHA